MKKIIAIISSCALMLGLASCAGNTENTSSVASNSYYDVIGASALDQSKVEITRVPEELFPEGGTTFDVAYTAPISSPVMQAKDLDGDGIIRVACIGDSITQGGETDNWPAFLQEYLDFISKTDGNTYEVKNYGKAGAAVKHVLEDTDGNGDGVKNEGGEYFFYDDPKYVESLTYKADIVIVQHGANDGLGGERYSNEPAAEGSNAGTLEDYFINDYTEYLIKPYVQNGAKVVLATPTYASNGYVDRYVNGWISEAVRAMAKAYGVQCVDLNKITQPRIDSFPDGIHGNAAGCKLMAQTYVNQIFGAELSTATVKTAKNAKIEMGIHSATANGAGEGVIYLLKGLEDSGEFDIKITCDDHKPFEGKVAVNGTVTLEYPLTPGNYNIAVGKAATASSVHLDDTTGEKINVPEFAVDGDMNTRWESQQKTDGQWFTVDLGKNYKINAVNIYWEGAYASKYKLLSSLDGQNFTELKTVEIDKEGLETTTFTEIEARYVKLEAITRRPDKQLGVSFYEFEVLTDYKD